jgi:hypothetical protein
METQNTISYMTTDEPHLRIIFEREDGKPVTWSDILTGCEEAKNYFEDAMDQQPAKIEVDPV